MTKKQYCRNCKHFQPYGDITNGEVDCSLNNSFSFKEYFYNYDQENECEYFTQSL